MEGADYFDTPISEITEGAENTRIVHHHDEIRLLVDDAGQAVLQLQEALEVFERGVWQAVRFFNYQKMASPGAAADLKIAARSGLRPSPLFPSTVVRPSAWMSVWIV